MNLSDTRFHPLSIVAVCFAALALGACSGDAASNIREVERDEYNTGSRREQLLRATSAAGASGGITLFGDTEKGRGEEGRGGGGGLGVNAYLWRATLDTLSFMPLSSADPFGGVIITDWHAPGGVTNERFKATAYVLGRQLRSDGSVFPYIGNRCGYYGGDKGGNAI